MSKSMHDTTLIQEPAPSRWPRWLRHLEMDVEGFRDDRRDGVALPWAIKDAICLQGRVAWAINDVGQALLNLSTRMCDGCPSSFDEWFNDGFRSGRDAGRSDIVNLMVRGDTEISVIGRLIVDLGMDPEKIVAHLEQREATR